MYGPLIVKPGESRKNKTGSWRVEVKPKFLKKNCAGCKLCVLICPEGCVEGSQKNNFVADLTYCKGCGCCAVICPKGDVVMIREEEKE